MLFVACCVPFAVRCFGGWCVVWCLLRVVRCVLCVVWCLLVDACCLLFAAMCVIILVCCLLLIVCCVLFCSVLGMCWLSRDVSCLLVVVRG